MSDGCVIGASLAWTSGNHQNTKHTNTSSCCDIRWTTTIVVRTTQDNYNGLVYHTPSIHLVSMFRGHFMLAKILQSANQLQHHPHTCCITYLSWASRICRYRTPDNSNTVCSILSASLIECGRGVFSGVTGESWRAAAFSSSSSRLAIDSRIRSCDATVLRSNEPPASNLKLVG